MKEGRFVGAGVCAALVLAATLCPCAATITISNFDEFKAWSETVRSTAAFGDSNVELGGDIVFSGAVDPVGFTQDQQCTAFTGTFDGNNFMISNMKVKGVLGAAGLFCALSGATIQNVIFDEGCSAGIQSSASYSGMVAGMANGTVKIVNVHNKGDVTSTKYAGGLVGYHPSDGAKLNVESCSNSGHIDSPDAVGGLVGQSEVITVFDNCTNRGRVGPQAANSGGVVGISLLQTQSAMSLNRKQVP